MYIFTLLYRCAAALDGGVPPTEVYRVRTTACESYSSSVERRMTRQPCERAATRSGRLEALGRVAGPPFAAAVAGVVDGASDPAVRDHLVSADIFCQDSRGFMRWFCSCITVLVTGTYTPTYCKISRCTTNVVLISYAYTLYN